jgi:cyclase
MFKRLCSLTLLCVLSAGASAAGGVFDFERRQLAPGVYLLVRPEVTREPVEPNALFIVNDSDVVVFEAGGSPKSAENILAHIRQVTNKPVSTVVNSHWHGDHNMGNQVWRAAFPTVKLVAHVATHAAMTGKPMAYVDRYKKLIPEYVADMEKRQAEGKLSARGQKALPDIRAMATEILRTTVTPPDTLVESGLVLQRGAREIHIQHLGLGNTPSDLVLWLPKERILATGDLVVHPLPYGFGSFPAQWIETLDKLAAYDFALLVPGHGEVQRDREYLKLVQAMLRSVRQQAAAAVIANQSLDDFKKSVDLTPYERAIAGEDADKKMKFRNWWIDPIARSAWLEARGEPIEQGASDETG